VDIDALLGQTVKRLLGVFADFPFLLVSAQDCPNG
jgi:hypothetical protein